MKGRQRGKSVLENEMVVFVLRAGATEHMNRTVEVLVRFRDKLRSRALTFACLRERRLDVGGTGVNRPHTPPPFHLAFRRSGCSVSRAFKRLLTVDARVRARSFSTTNLWCTV